MGHVSGEGSNVIVDLILWVGIIGCIFGLLSIIFHFFECAIFEGLFKRKLSNRDIHTRVILSQVDRTKNEVDIEALPDIVNDKQIYLLVATETEHVGWYHLYLKSSIKSTQTSIYRVRYNPNANLRELNNLSSKGYKLAKIMKFKDEEIKSSLSIEMFKLVLQDYLGNHPEVIERECETIIPTSMSAKTLIERLKYALHVDHIEEYDKWCDEYNYQYIRSDKWRK